MRVIEISENSDYAKMMSGVYRKILNYLRMRSWLSKRKGKAIEFILFFFFSIYSNFVIVFSNMFGKNKDKCAVANKFERDLQAFMTRTFSTGTNYFVLLIQLQKNASWMHMCVYKMLSMLTSRVMFSSFSFTNR